MIVTDNAMPNPFFARTPGLVCTKETISEQMGAGANLFHFTRTPAITQRSFATVPEVKDQQEINFHLNAEACPGNTILNSKSLLHREVSCGRNLAGERARGILDAVTTVGRQSCFARTVSREGGPARRAGRCAAGRRARQVQSRIEKNAQIAAPGD